MAIDFAIARARAASARSGCVAGLNRLARLSHAPLRTGVSIPREFIFNETIGPIREDAPVASAIAYVGPKERRAMRANETRLMNGKCYKM